MSGAGAGSSGAEERTGGAEVGTGGDAGQDSAELAADLQRVLLVSTRILRSQVESGEISVSQFSVLAYLERNGESTPGALAEFDHVSPPVMTRLLGRLEQAGLVRRGAHPADGRQVLVSLSEEGRRQVVAGRERRHAWLRERIESASEAQQAALREGTRALREILLPPRD